MKNKKDLRVIFMGTPLFAREILNALLKDGYNIISVYTQPDKKVGRKQELQKSPAKILAQENNIKVYEPRKLDESAVNEIREQKPDLIIVAAYGKILPESLLSIPPYNCINIHGSLLPELRGPSPIQNALLKGLVKTGTTIMLMGKGIDTGDILSQEEISIDEKEKFPELLEKMAKVSCDLLLKTLPLWIDKKITSQKQDDSKATYCKIIKKEDGQVDWKNSAREIYNQFRAFYIWPGIFSLWENKNGLKRIKLNQIELKEDLNPDLPEGSVFLFEGEIGVKASKGSIIIKELQLEGKSNIKTQQFIAGYRDFIGSILK